MKIISSKQAFSVSVQLGVTVGVVAPCGTRLGVLFNGLTDERPIDLTIMREGDCYVAIPLSPDGSAFLELCD